MALAPAPPAIAAVSMPPRARTASEPTVSVVAVNAMLASRVTTTVSAPAPPVRVSIDVAVKAPFVRAIVLAPVTVKVSPAA
jgi:hypothetical protein